MRSAFLTAAAALALFALSGTGYAQDGDGKLTVELNKLEPQGTACQAYIVLQNGTEAAYDELALDLVMFDTDGVIARRLAVDMAPLRAGRTSVKVFAVDGLACDGISRILINDVLSCVPTGEAEGQADCVGLIETTSRASAELIN
ncbi:MAG: hypothetical protein AAGE18_08050 [Pseudomonadota bacterium]